MWPYLLGVYPVDSSADARRTQDEVVLERYKKLSSEWQVAESLALKREQENAASDFPATKLSLSDNHHHAAKIAFFRKDSSLSNDVFESLDAPVGGTNGDESCRPETVVEESSSVTSPTTELAVDSESHVSGSELECSAVIESLPVKPGL